MSYKLLLYFFCSLLFMACSKNRETKSVQLKKDTLSSAASYTTVFSKLTAPYKEEKLNQITAFYKKNIHSNDFNGAFLVAKNGEILFEDYQGFSNFETKDKICATTPLHLASISKVLTATVIIRLINDNKIQLDQSLQSLFPEFPHKNITIRLLLNHRSGLAHYAYFSEIDTIWDRRKILHNQDILALLSSKNIPLEFQPNTKFAYCNTNYALLALVIEKVTKMNYPTAMQKLLFEPLAMSNSFVFEFEKHKDVVSQSYKGSKKKIPFDHLDAIYGDKNIYTSAQDLLKFDKATYSNTFLPKKLKEEIYKGYSYERKGIKNYGLGIRLNEFKNGQSIHYHNGWWHGNTTSYITLKKDTVTMIALSNKYTRKVYQTKKLAAIFGDYPFELD